MTAGIRILPFIFCSCLISFLPCAASAQPSAITPEDVSRTRQLTTFSWDWSNSDAFDFDKPLELSVTVERLVIPERGNAELLFSMTDRQRSASDVRWRPQRRYHATLQSAEALRRLAVRVNDMPEGLDVNLVGWAASSRNITPSVMLVDEIEIPSIGRRIKLHDHPGMERRRTREPSKGRESE